MENGFSYHLSVAEVPICVRSDQELIVGEEFLPFLTEAEPAAVTAVFRCVNHLRSHPEKILTEENCYRVYSDGQGDFLRGFYNVHCREQDYALETYQRKEKKIEIDYLAAGADFVRSMANAFFHMGIEGVLIREKKICCHAALVQTAYGGILFSGPSGIGKSTQAELWCRFEDGIQINGDRPIVGKKEEQWIGWGSPYAGSSRCYVNASCPIAAVVLLDKAPFCEIQRLPVAQAYRSIYAGLTVNAWDPLFDVQAFDLAVQMGKELPVYRLACTPDQRAVDLLKQQLEKD